MQASGEHLQGNKKVKQSPRGHLLFGGGKKNNRYIDPLSDDWRGYIFAHADYCGEK